MPPLWPHRARVRCALAGGRVGEAGRYPICAITFWNSSGRMVSAHTAPKCQLEPRRHEGHMVSRAHREHGGLRTLRR